MTTREGGWVVLILRGCLVWGPEMENFSTAKRLQLSSFSSRVSGWGGGSEKLQKNSEKSRKTTTIMKEDKAERKSLAVGKKRREASKQAKIV